MSQFSGNINIANSNTNVFTNTLCNDMVIYTSNNTQRIVLGTSNIGTVVINSNNAWITGSLGVGTSNPAYKFHVALGSTFVGDVAYTGANVTSTANGYQLVFDNSYNNVTGAGVNCNKILMFNNNANMFGFGIENGGISYQSGANHRFYTATTNAAYGTQVLNIGSNVYFKRQLNLTDLVSTTDTLTWPIINFSGAGGIQGETNTSTYDWGLIKFNTASTASVFGRITVGTHADSAVDQGFFSSSSTPLLVTKGGTGDTYIRGNLGVGVTNPGVKVDIAGQLRYTGQLTTLSGTLTNIATGTTTYLFGNSFWNNPPDVSGMYSAYGAGWTGIVSVISQTTTQQCYAVYLLIVVIGTNGVNLVPRFLHNLGSSTGCAVVTYNDGANGNPVGFQNTTGSTLTSLRWTFTRLG